MPIPADHPQRRALSDLMHERTLPILAGPVVVRSWLFLVDDEERAEEQKALATLVGDGTPERWHAHFTQDSGGLIYERHGEFSTWLAYRTGLDPEAKTDNLGFTLLKEADYPAMQAARGEVFRSVEIPVLPYDPPAERLAGAMDLSHAVSCDVFGGAARIWSDFRLHDGCGRIYVQDKGLRNDEPARLLQTLIEIGHYRKLALLGFPVSRALFDWLKTAEDQLSAITSDMAAHNAPQAAILDRLLSLSAEIESRVNAVRFRQGATEAYARLAHDRLRSLNEARVQGFSTMQEFIDRRLEPAMRTCEAAARRLDDLSVRVGRASDLLRARISISLEVQNQDLLRSMNLRAKLQMKLSTLVEGLSVFAVSYYIFSLIKYGLDSLLKPETAHKLYAPIILFILALAFVFIHIRKKSLTTKQAGEEV